MSDDVPKDPFAPPPPGYVPPPPPDYSAPPPYGYPPGPTPYGYAVQETAGKATAVLVLGIGSLVLFCVSGLGFILAIIALCLAPGARREIAASDGRYQGEGQVKAGVICSWIAIGLTILAIAGLVVLILAFANSAGD